LHEISIAINILAMIEEEFMKIPNAKKIKKIKLKVGALSLIDISALRFALTVASKETPAEGATIEIEPELPRFRCKRCNYEWGMDDADLKSLVGRHGIATILHMYPDVIVNFFSCPRCGSNNIEILKGRGILVDSFNIETEDEKREVLLKNRG